MDNLGALIARILYQHGVMEKLSLFTGFKNTRPLMRPCHLLLCVPFKRLFMCTERQFLKKKTYFVQDTSSQVRFEVHRWKLGTIKVPQSFIYTIVLACTSL